MACDMTSGSCAASPAAETDTADLIVRWCCRRRRSPSRDRDYRRRSYSRDRDYRRRSPSRDRYRQDALALHRIDTIETLQPFQNASASRPCATPLKFLCHLGCLTPLQSCMHRDRDSYRRRSPPPTRYGGGYDARGRSPPRGMGRRPTPPQAGLHMFVAGLNFICTERVRAWPACVTLGKGFERFVAGLSFMCTERVRVWPACAVSKGFAILVFADDPPGCSRSSRQALPSPGGRLSGLTGPGDALPKRHCWEKERSKYAAISCDAGSSQQPDVSVRF